MRSSRLFFASVAALILTLGGVHADLRVATLHPLMTDLAKQVGGEHVKVVEMVKPGTDPHDFSPKPADLKSIKDVALVLASGKNMENYLGKLRDNLAASQTLLEVGKTIPDLTEAVADKLQLEEDAEEHDHHDHAEGEHHHHGPDPHWWNSPKNMERAANIVAEAFSKADAANAAVYAANAKVFAARVAELRKWAKKEISTIPQANRKIASAHDSLGYFAQEFNFKLLAIQGVSPSVKATSQEIAGSIAKIKKHQIKAIFPEQGVNPKQIEEIIRETGVKKGGELIADGNGTGELATFEKAFKHNVETLVGALK